MTPTGSRSTMSNPAAAAQIATDVPAAHAPPPWRIWLLLGAALLGSLCWGLMVGQYPLALGEVIAGLTSRLRGTAVLAAPDIETVIWKLRMPRLIAAVLVGGTLAAAGAAYQGMFRNPLVSPDILGVSSGAGLGAVLGIFLGLPMGLIQTLAFVGGLAAVALVYAIAKLVRRHDPVLVLVLAGLALGTLLGAGISLLKILADPYTQLPTITFWLLGGLSAVSLDDLGQALPLMLIGLVPLLLLRWRMNLLSLGDEEAAALGINVRLTRLLLILGATLMTASAISFTGIIGWVGLVVPHMARLLVGPSFSRLLPASLLLGAAFLTLTDTLARTMTSIELPLGILTALIGAPFFLFLLARGGARP